MGSTVGVEVRCSAVPCDFFGCGWSVGRSFRGLEKSYSKEYEVGSENIGDGKKYLEENLKWIVEYNAKDGLQHELGLGPFADMTSEEFCVLSLLSKASQA